jgi:pyruvate carboxylase
MVFIGPTPEVIDSLGDKVSARNAAIKENVPVVPGTDGPVEELGAAQDFVDKYGYPVIIKAAYGGGGRGMRVVREGDNLQDAFNRATSEYVYATRFFGGGCL